MGNTDWRLSLIRALDYSADTMHIITSKNLRAVTRVSVEFNFQIADLLLHCVVGIEKLWCSLVLLFINNLLVGEYTILGDPHAGWIKFADSRFVGTFALTA